MASSKLVVIDCPANAPGPTMRIAGMLVAERLAKEQLRSGHQVLIRCSAELFTRLGVTDADHLELAAEIPAGARCIAATRLGDIELTSREAQQRAEWATMQDCRRPYDGPADRYILRSISLRLSRFLTRFAVTPNHVTVVSTLCGLTTCALLLWYGAQTWSLRVCAATVFAAVILDSVDGELARVRHMGSRLGMWMDNLSDDVIDTTLVIAMGVAVSGTMGDIWFTLAAVAFGMRIFAAFVTYRGAAKLGHPGDVMAFRWWFESEQETEAVYGNPLAPLTLLRSLGRRDVYVTIFALSFLTGFPIVGLVLAMANAVSHFVMAVLHIALSTDNSTQQQ